MTNVEFNVVQQSVFEWCKRNFPNADATQELLGVVEEVGELTHAHLKNIQGIRGMDDEDKYFEEMVDAVGDILIYLTNFCSFSGIAMDDAFYRTWSKVQQRDWIADPQNAGETVES